MQKKIEELVQNTLSWSKAKGLDKADFRKQIAKLHEEFGELTSGYLKDNPEVLKDSVGDILVVLTILMQQVGCSESKIKSAIKGFHFSSGLCEPDTDDLLMQIGSVVGLVSDGYRYRGMKLTDLVERNSTLIVSYLKQFTDDLGINYLDCFQMAWDEIKDRTGQMVNGSFVKSSDIRLG